MSDVLRPTDYTPKSYLLPSDAFQTYQSATGGTLDSTTGLLTISSSQYSNLQTLSFNIGSTCYDLSPNAQIWPRSLNSAIGGSAGSIYLVVSDIGSTSGSGLDFIDGYTFLYVFLVFLILRGCLLRVSILASGFTVFSTRLTNVSGLLLPSIPMQQPTKTFLVVRSSSVVSIMSTSGRTSRGKCERQGNGELNNGHVHVDQKMDLHRICSTPRAHH